MDQWNEVFILLYFSTGHLMSESGSKAKQPISGKSA
jgi:hypothetical protein